MSADWKGVQERLTQQIVCAVEEVHRDHPGVVIDHVEVGELHTRDMLVLWPTVTLVFTDNCRPPLEIDTPRAGDHLAAGVTAAGGLGGLPWTDLFRTYQQTIRGACSAAEKSLHNSLPHNGVRCILVGSDDGGPADGHHSAASTATLIAELSGSSNGNTADVARQLARRGLLATVVAVLSESASEPHLEDTILAVLTDHYSGSRRWCALDYAPLDAALSTWPMIELPLRRTFSSDRMYTLEAAEVVTATHALSSSWAAIREHAAIVLLSAHV